jgi:hypothetical protein
MSIRIPIKRYEDDPSLTWEERYARLEAHHREETEWMMRKLKELDGELQHALCRYCKQPIGT